MLVRARNEDIVSRIQSAGIHAVPGGCPSVEAWVVTSWNRNREFYIFNFTGHCPFHASHFWRFV